MKQITLLTGYDRFFGQTRKPWISMNVDALTAALQKHGYQVIELEFTDLANNPALLNDSTVLYTFSQRDNLREYLLDVIRILHNRGSRLIPSYNLACCHENKGYQMLFARQLQITDLWSIYCSSKRELAHHQLRFPLVFKTIEGSNGKGVHLIQSHRDLSSVMAQLEPSLSLLKRIDLLRRRVFRHNERFPAYPQLSGIENYRAYADYIKPEIPFILQEYVDGLEYDFRVIILGSRCYVIKRLVRKNDFRASGAKRFVFDRQIDPMMLDYAYDIYQKLDTPFISIDIGVKDGRFYLFEFQALHFGINAMVKSPGYFILQNTGWEFIEERVSIEQCIADAVAGYLQKLSS